MTRQSRTRLHLLLSGSLAALLAASTLGAAQAAGPASPVPASSVPGSSTVAAAPAVSFVVTRAARGLSQPWDVKVIDRGRLLITERETRRLLVSTGGSTRQVRFPMRGWANGETGLMSLEVDPNFAKNRRFYTCAGGFRPNGNRDVRVSAWRLDRGATRATLAKHLVTGIPATTGRHGGCRLLIPRNGSLMIGTGDAADERNPQRTTTLAGKTLRVNRFSGQRFTGNPFPAAKTRAKRILFTYGHRNVQGLAQRNDGSIWSVEHGPGRDDEVNRLFRGANYGWNPGPGYDENRPMTDFSLPGTQLGARWRSGAPTVATSGADWVRGSKWRGLNGTLAVAALKDSSVRFMRFDGNGRLVGVRRPAALTRFGRLRSVVTAPNGDLLVTTANGSNDAVLRVRPRG